MMCPTYSQVVPKKRMREREIEGERKRTINQMGGM